MKKRLYWVFGTLLGLVLVLITTLILLLGTETGLRWALRQTARIAPELLEIGALEGHLLGRLQVQKMQLNLPTMRLRIDDLVLDWQPSALLQREFHLTLLKIDAVTIEEAVGLAKESPETAQEKPPYPIALADVKLPLTVIIDAVQINGVEIVNNPMRIENIALQARWDDKGIAIQQFDVAMPALQFAADGRINPVGDYPLEIHTLLSLSHESLPNGQLQGTIAGDKRQIDITQRFDGDAQIDLGAAITAPLENLAWDGTLVIKEIPGRLISPALAAHIKGKINTRGDLKGAQFDGHLLANSPSDPMIDVRSEFAIAADFEQSSILISKLQVNHQTQPMQLSMTGSAWLEDNRFDLKGDWQDIQWPLTGEPIGSSAKGKFSANGAIHNYQFKLATDLSGKDIPQGQWTIQGTGNKQSLAHVEVVGETLDGVLKTIGKLSWVPALSYDFTTTAQQLNPGAQYPDWQGAIDMNASISGMLSEAGPTARVALNSLTGELRGLPIRGNGVVNVHPEEIKVEGLVIGSGHSEIRANGELGAHSKLRWEIDVPNASDLLPEATGRLVGSGMVQGPQTQPRISGRVEAKSLHAQQFALDQLTAELDVDLSSQRTSNIELAGQGLMLGTQQISQLSVTATGTLDAHEMETSVSHQQGQLKLALQGGLKGELWKGLLQRLSLQSDAFGNWDLERATALTASATRALAAPLCMRREAARLCAEGKWDKPDAQPQRASGSFEIAAFQLGWLQPLVPAEIQHLDGELSANGNVELGKTIQAHADVNITPGKIDYLHPETGEVSLPHDGARIVADVRGNGVKGEVKLRLAENRITASFNSPDVLAVEDPRQATIDANIALDGPKLDFLTAMVPQLSALNGSIRLDFDVQGTIGRPRLNGEGKINIARLDAPEYGVALNDSSIDIAGRGETVEIDGLLASTEGKIAIKGNSQLDAQSGWPLKIEIKGDNFLAVNLPEARILISPDLVIEKTSQALRLAGNITVPKADIFLKTLPPSARSAHEDVVVLQDADTEKAAQPMPLEMNVTLTLGKEIHFVGFGLDAFFDGKLNGIAKPNEVLSVAGDIRIDQGTYRAFGQDLTIERGIISFAGGPPGNPGINLRATRQIDEVIVGINAIGSINKPRITTFSTPAMSENDVISYLLIGKPASDIGQGGDRKLAISRQANSKLSVSVGTNLDTGEVEFSTRYRLTREVHLEGTTTPRSSAADIFYTWELE
jgi:translocation and assembly module TamB